MHTYVTKCDTADVEAQRRASGEMATVGAACVIIARDVATDQPRAMINIVPVPIDVDTFIHACRTERIFDEQPCRRATNRRFGLRGDHGLVIRRFTGSLTVVATRVVRVAIHLVSLVSFVSRFDVNRFLCVSRACHVRVTCVDNEEIRTRRGAGGVCVCASEQRQSDIFVVSSHEAMCYVNRDFSVTTFQLA